MNNLLIITVLFLFLTMITVPSFADELKNVDSVHSSLIENHMPTDIKVKIADFCIHIGEDNSSKEKTSFLSTLHIKILSMTPEFQSLDGKLDSITAENGTIATSCPPPRMAFNGAFTSVNGNEFKYHLEYNATMFKYQIDDIFPSQYVDYIESPLKQFKSWNALDTIQSKPNLLLGVIQCKEGLISILKYDDIPACIKPETKIKLIERGWTTIS